ncbi:MAG: 4-alpha-glucanotransferase, partial [Candidatus Omnitrophota bacterium]
MRLPDGTLLTLTDLIQAAKGELTGAEQQTERAGKAKEIVELIRKVREDSGRGRLDAHEYQDGTGGLLASLSSGDEYDTGIGDLHTLELLIELSRLVGWNIVYILPLNMSSYGDSPYSILNNLKDLVYTDTQKLFAMFPRAKAARQYYFDEKTQAELKTARNKNTLDYDLVRSVKLKTLQLIFEEFRQEILRDKAYRNYCGRMGDKFDNDITHMFLRRQFMDEPGVHNGWDWRLWPEDYRDKDSGLFKQSLSYYDEETKFQMFGQWVFSTQWDSLHKKAEDYHIQVITDLPYSCPDAMPYSHYLETKGRSKIVKLAAGGWRVVVQGVPADMFGPPQFWQFTIYDFSQLEALRYWLERLGFTYQCSDKVRFDHGFGLFRIFEFTQGLDGEHSWASLGLSEIIRQARKTGMGMPREKQLEIAADIYREILKTVYSSQAFKPWQKLLFEDENKLTPDSAVFIAREASMRNRLDRWFEIQDALAKPLSRVTDDQDLLRGYIERNIGEKRIMEMLETILARTPALEYLRGQIFAQGHPVKDLLNRQLETRQRVEQQLTICRDDVQDSLEEFFARHPQWRALDANVRDESGNPYKYGDVFNEDGQPDIFRAQVMLELEEKYSLRENPNFSRNTLVRWPMIEHWSKYNNRYHDCITIAENEDNAQANRKEKYYPRLYIDTLADYLFNPDKAPADQDRIMISCFRYTAPDGGLNKKKRIIDGGEKILTALLQDAAAQKKQLIGEFLGASTSEIEEALERVAEKFDLLSYRVFQFGIPFEDARNMNAGARWNRATHLTLTVHDFHPFNTWITGKTDEPGAAGDEQVKEIVALVNNARGGSPASSSPLTETQRVFVRETMQGWEVKVNVKSKAKPVFYWAVDKAGKWYVPPRGSWPAGTLESKDGSAVTTPMRLEKEGMYGLTLYLSKNIDFTKLAFVLSYPERGEWDNNNGQNYLITLRESPLEVSRTPAGRLHSKEPLTISAYVNSTTAPQEIKAELLVFGLGERTQTIEMGYIRSEQDKHIFRGVIWPTAPSMFEYQVQAAVDQETFLSDKESLVIQPPTGEEWTQGPAYKLLYQEGRGEVYLGNYAAAADAEKLGFDAVLNLAAELELNLPGNIHYKKIRLLDGAHNLISAEDVAQAVNWLNQELALGRRIIVHCRAGIGRTGSIGVAFIYARNPEQGYDWAVNYVKQRKPDIFPHNPDNALCRTLGRLFPKTKTEHIQRLPLERVVVIDLPEMGAKPGVEFTIDRERAVRSTTNLIRLLHQSRVNLTDYFYWLQKPSLVSQLVHGLDYEEITKGKDSGEFRQDKRKLIEYLHRKKTEFGIGQEMEICDARIMEELGEYHLYLQLKVNGCIMAMGIGYVTKHTKYNVNGKTLVYDESQGNPFSLGRLSPAPVLMPPFQEEDLVSLVNQAHMYGGKAIFNWVPWFGADALTAGNYQYFAHEIVNPQMSDEDILLMMCKQGKDGIIFHPDGERKVFLYYRGHAQDQLKPDLSAKSADGRYFWEDFYFEQAKYFQDHFGFDGGRLDLICELYEEKDEEKDGKKVKVKDFSLIQRVLLRNTNYARQQNKLIPFLLENYAQENRDECRSWNEKAGYTAFFNYFEDVYNALFIKKDEPKLSRLKKALEWLINPQSAEIAFLTNFDLASLVDLIPDQTTRRRWIKLGLLLGNFLFTARDLLELQGEFFIPPGGERWEHFFVTHKHPSQEEFDERRETDLADLFERSYACGLLQRLSEAERVGLYEEWDHGQLKSIGITFYLEGGAKDRFILREYPKDNDSFITIDEVKENASASSALNSFCFADRYTLLKSLEMYFSSGRKHFMFGPEGKRLLKPNIVKLAKFTLREQADIERVLLTAALEMFEEITGKDLSGVLRGLKELPLEQPEKYLVGIDVLTWDLRNSFGSGLKFKNEGSGITLSFPAQIYNAGNNAIVNKFQQKLTARMKAVRSLFKHQNFRILVEADYWAVTMLDKAYTVAGILNTLAAAGVIIRLGNSPQDIPFLNLPAPRGMVSRSYYLGAQEEISGFPDISFSGENCQGAYRILREAIERHEQGIEKMTAVITDIDDSIAPNNGTISQEMSGLLKRALQAGIKVYFISGGEYEDGYEKRIIDRIEETVLCSSPVKSQPAEFWQVIRSGIYVLPVYYQRPENLALDPGIGKYTDIPDTAAYVRKNLGMRVLQYLPFGLSLPWEHSPYGQASGEWFNIRFIGWPVVPEALPFLPRFGYYKTNRIARYEEIDAREFKIGAAAYGNLKNNKEFASRYKEFLKFAEEKGAGLEIVGRYLAFNHVLGNNEQAWYREGLDCVDQDSHWAVTKYNKEHPDFQYRELINYFKYAEWVAYTQVKDALAKLLAMGMYYIVDIPFYESKGGIAYWLHHRDGWFEGMDKCPGVPGNNPGEKDQFWGCLARWNWDKIRELGFEPFVARYRFWLSEMNANGVRADAVHRMYRTIFDERFQSANPPGDDLLWNLNRCIDAYGAFKIGEQLGPPVEGMGFAHDPGWHLYSVPKWGGVKYNSGWDIEALELHDGWRLPCDPKYGFIDGANHSFLNQGWIKNRIKDLYTWLLLQQRDGIPMIYAGDEVADTWWLNNPWLADNKIGDNWRTRMPRPGDPDFDPNVANEIFTHFQWIGGELNKRSSSTLKYGVSPPQLTFIFNGSIKNPFLFKLWWSDPDGFVMFLFFVSSPLTAGKEGTLHTFIGQARIGPGGMYPGRGDMLCAEERERVYVVTRVPEDFLRRKGLEVWIYTDADENGQWTDRIRMHKLYKSNPQDDRYIGRLRLRRQGVIQYVTHWLLREAGDVIAQGWSGPDNGKKARVNVGYITEFIRDARVGPGEMYPRRGEVFDALQGEEVYVLTRLPGEFLHWPGVKVYIHSNVSGSWRDDVQMKKLRADVDDDRYIGKLNLNRPGRVEFIAHWVVSEGDKVVAEGYAGPDGKENGCFQVWAPVDDLQEESKIFRVAFVLIHEHYIREISYKELISRYRQKMMDIVSGSFDERSASRWEWGFWPMYRAPEEELRRVSMRELNPRSCELPAEDGDAYLDLFIRIFVAINHGMLNPALCGSLFRVALNRVLSSLDIYSAFFPLVIARMVESKESREDGVPEKKMVENNIGYVRLSAFNKETSEALTRALLELKNRGMTKLILDLRGNGGGLVKSVKRTLRLFMPAGTEIAAFEDRSKGKTVCRADESGKYCGYPLVVLVNGDSYSAAELFAAAVQDNKIGALVGKRTGGKGVGQTYYTLGDGSCLVITFEKWLTPRGRCVQGTGIEPDIEVDGLGAQFWRAVEVLRSSSPLRNAANGLFSSPLTNDSRKVWTVDKPIWWVKTQDAFIVRVDKPGFAHAGVCVDGKNWKAGKDVDVQLEPVEQEGKIVYYEAAIPAPCDVFTLCLEGVWQGKNYIVERVSQGIAARVLKSAGFSGHQLVKEIVELLISKGIDLKEEYKFIIKCLQELRDSEVLSVWLLRKMAAALKENEITKENYKRYILCPKLWHNQSEYSYIHWVEKERPILIREKRGAEVTVGLIIEKGIKDHNIRIPLEYTGEN